MHEAWTTYHNGETIGKKGTEGGIILNDEKCPGARITLEGGGATAPFAITCGAGGVLVHTIFFRELATAQQSYRELKAKLKEIADTEDWSKAAALAKDLVRQFP